MKYYLKDFVGKSASYLLEKLEYNEPPYNPFKIADSLKITVKQDLTPDNMKISGSITRVDEEVAIWINPLDADVRQNFTLAHELGHCMNDIFNDSDGKIIDTPETLYRSGRAGTDRCEYNANLFAANLLMPEPDIVRIGKEILAETQAQKMKAKAFTEQMAKRFEVSKSAMSVRLKYLKII